MAKSKAYALEKGTVLSSSDCLDFSDLGGPIDLGGAIVTGLDGNPVAVMAKQLEMPLHPVTPRCPLYDRTGQKYDEEFDLKTEAKFNDMLDKSKKLKVRPFISLILSTPE